MLEFVSIKNSQNGFHFFNKCFTEAVASAFWVMYNINNLYIYTKLRAIKRIFG